MESNKLNKKIVLNLSNDEALVLLNWLIRFNENEMPSLFEDQSEERVLFDLESVLEQSISEIFSKNYKELLSQARDNIRDEE